MALRSGSFATSAERQLQCGLCLRALGDRGNHASPLFGGVIRDGNTGSTTLKLDGVSRADHHVQYSGARPDGVAHTQGRTRTDRPPETTELIRTFWDLAPAGRLDHAIGWSPCVQSAAARTMIRHPLAWCAWAVAALAIALIDRNPYLQGLMLLVIVNTWLPYRRGHAPHLRIGLALAAIPVLFSVALSRFGHHVIVVVPSVPIVGGPWTWEALAFGASSGLALLLTVAIFGILQSTVRSADLLPLLPGPLYRAGTALALSLTFAPKTISSFQSIREARQVRGQRTGWRAAPSLLVPLLLTALEQALQYAESLDARGYGSRRRSRYRPLAWSAGDLIVTAASLAALALTPVLTPSPYNPYLDLAPILPSAASVLLVLLLALPGVAAAIPRMEHAPHHA